MSSENMKYALVVLNEYNLDAILHERPRLRM